MRSKSSSGLGSEALGFLLLTGLLLGLALPVSRAAIAQGWSATGLAFWSIAGAALGLVVACYGWPHRGTRPAGLRRYGFWNGLLALAWPQAVSFSAAPHIGVGAMALVVTLSAPLTYCLSVALGMEALRLRRALGIGIALGGAMVLARGQQGVEEGFSWPWFLLALTVPFSLAVGNIYRKKMMPAGVSSIHLARGMLACGALGLLPVAWATGNIYPALSGMAGWSWLLVQAVLFALGYSVYFRLQKAVNPVHFSLIGYVMAVVGVIAGLLWFGEQLSLVTGLAMALIVFGVWQAGRR